MPEKKSPEIAASTKAMAADEKISAEIGEKTVGEEKPTVDEMVKQTTFVETATTQEEPEEAACEVDFDKIAAAWQAVVDKILEKHFSLSSVLRLSLPLRCAGNMLDIGVANKFFKDRMETAANKQIVEDAIKEISGFTVRIRGVVSEKLAIASPYSDTGPAISSGGKITIETKEPTAAPAAPPITALPKGDAVAEVMSMF